MKEIIVGREGNQALSITDMTVSRQHCKVSVNPDGSCVVENLSPNGTRINGVPIVKAKAQPDSILRLGPNFSIPLSQLICQQSVQRSSPVCAEGITYSVGHLKHVWEEFNNKNIAIAKRQARINLIRSIIGTLGVCIFPAMLFIGQYAYAISAVIILANIYCFAVMKNAETPEAQQKRFERFEEQWVCPNPHCHHTLATNNYRKLINDFKSCPYCNCNYTA